MLLKEPLIRFKKIGVFLVYHFEYFPYKNRAKIEKENSVFKKGFFDNFEKLSYSETLIQILVQFSFNRKHPHH